MESLSRCKSRESQKFHGCSYEFKRDAHRCVRFLRPYWLSPYRLPYSFGKCQMPFNGAELWSLHQYYFSPAPEPPVTPIDGTESVPSPSDARSSTAAAASTAQAGAAVSGKDRHAGYVCTGWADAVVAMSPRKVNVRGCDGANRDGFGQSDGSTSVTEVSGAQCSALETSRRSCRDWCA